MIKRLLELVRGNELDRMLGAAGSARILVYWNRGLGDIALGLYGLFERIREVRPAAAITVLTRADLADAFRLLDVSRVIVDPALARGEDGGFAKACQRLALDPRRFDVVMERPNPTKWLAWQRGKVVCRLAWDPAFDALAKRLSDRDVAYVGMHVSSETARFYGYVKDWPAERWRALFDALGEPIRPVLFGLAREPRFEAPGLIDLRGETGLLEMLSLVKNRCRVLVAPDSGVLTMAYYLNVDAPLTIISLWSDPRQGVLKQGVASPNPRLRHVPLVGAGEDVRNVTVEEVARRIREAIS